MDATFSMTTQALRRRLNIPDDAEKVLIFGESSHWDPNWLYTSEEYFERFVASNLDQALDALVQEPRRVYSIECMFFLRMYWERRPEKQALLRELLNSGRLRLTSSGVTTADTLLPSSEALLRDWLLGQEWLREQGIEQEPTLAYFTDSFGATPHLPTLLRAAGFDGTAITRVDGMYFPGCELPIPGKFPRPGSSAFRLLKEERSLDFIWRDSNGAEVLCHWNAFTYGQGDMLAYAGLSRVYLARVAFQRRSEGHIARRIQGYVKQLAPYARTPYLFCPIGFDFVEPIPDLVALLDRYNRRRYPHTGVWAVNAGLDDYLALVEGHRDRLPVLELDPNPYWTGFYTARPTLKARCHRLADDLLLAEKLTCLPKHAPVQDRVNRELREPWWQAAVSNHHDFITGTSPDRVVQEEQLPWLAEAIARVDAILDELAPSAAAISPEQTSASPPSWTREGSLVRVRTPFHELVWDEHAGGALVQWLDIETGASLLTGPSFDLLSNRDSGGLWRMGYEFTGGIWKEQARASQQRIPLQVQSRGEAVEVISECMLEGEMFRRRAWVTAASPVVHFLVEGKAAEGRSVIVRFQTEVRGQILSMDSPGGVVERPPQRVYRPTFWPLHRFLHVHDRQGGRGLAVMQALPGAAAWQPQGQLDLVAARNATQEKAFGLIGIPGNPASGHEQEAYRFHFALLFTPAGDWRAHGIHRLAWSMRPGPWDDAGLRQGLADALLAVDAEDVRIAAIKPAWRGGGMIVRLEAPAPLSHPIHVQSPRHPVARAWQCDARERDIRPLDVDAQGVAVSMDAAIVTLRLTFAPPSPHQAP